MDQNTFSIRRAFENDFTFTPPILISLVIWFVYMMLMVVYGRNPIFFYAAIAATVAAIATLVWRLTRIRKLFLEGRVVTGAIRNTQFIKDRGRINFNYDYGGQDYTGTVVVHITERSKSYQDGQVVELVVNPEKPQQSYLRELYI